MAFLLLLLFAVMFLPIFLGFRRQKRELARQSTLQDSLVVGDEVLTFSGVYGTIVDIDDTVVELEIAPSVVTRWSRMSIREKVAETDLDESYDDDDDDVFDETTVDDESTGTATVGDTTVDESAGPSLTKSPDNTERPGTTR